MKAALWRVSGLPCLVLALALPGAAEHTPSLSWMAPYKSASGVGCCSERDCVPAPVAILQFGEHETTVMIHGTVLVLPAKSVHPSEDGTAYWCWKGEAQLPPTPDNTRCVFFAVGS